MHKMLITSTKSPTVDLSDKYDRNGCKETQVLVVFVQRVRYVDGGWNGVCGTEEVEVDGSDVEVRYITGDNYNLWGG
jgi:hypothetical protein